jgi:hypothetical protein
MPPQWLCGFVIISGLTVYPLSDPGGAASISDKSLLALGLVSPVLSKVAGKNAYVVCSLREPCGMALTELST